MPARPQLDVAVAAYQAQQEPDLLLAAVGGSLGFALAARPLFRHFVAQPLARAPENAHVRVLQADLFLQLAVHGL